MRVLLTANASYAPARGGSTRSNLVWLADLARRGHTCRVVCPTDGDAPENTEVIDGIEIVTVRDLSRRTDILQEKIVQFDPDWVLVSSEDVAHTLLRAAAGVAGGRLIYLAHTPQWYPFGPASWHPDSTATDIIRRTRAVVAIAHTTAAYIQDHSGIRSHVIHPPIYGHAPWPRLGDYENPYVLMINPSVVKGISIFLELAKRFPELTFAGLAGWGTTSGDRAAMSALPNVRVLETVPDIDDVLRQARVLLMPSLWFEGFGLIAMEAMLRGVPVISSNAGGLVEAKQGTGYIIPVRPIEQFESAFDETHMPRPIEPPQDIEPWIDALGMLTSDAEAWQTEAQRSRDVAEHFVSLLDAGEFERLLQRIEPERVRILLAHNSLYYPSHGGGDKSNRLLMEALAARGHQVRVISRVESFGKGDADKLLSDLSTRHVDATVSGDGVIHFSFHGVQVKTVAFESNLRAVFSREIDEFKPSVILTSTDDPGQLLFDIATRSPASKVVYLIRATIAVPFGPDSSAPNRTKTEALKAADGVIGVSEYVARYAREHGLTHALHLPISLLEPGPEPEYLARFDNDFITIVNPSAVKGIGIFLELADRFPSLRFAAVPTWGTNPEDYAALQRRPNVTIVPPVDNIDDLLRRTGVLLVPSVWAEARSRIVPEAMERGVPVISSNAGGLPEAHMGVDYVLPVNVIRHYQTSVDMNMVPLADVPPQDISPWESALHRLTTDETHWTEISRQSREAALRYARRISVLPFESYLLNIVHQPRIVRPRVQLSETKRKLLALRLKQRSAPTILAGTEHLKPSDNALLCLPWAGGGTLGYLRWRSELRELAVPVAVRLPGRESRLQEAPFEAMTALIESIAPAVAKLLRSRPAAFFGHSMGSGTAFELCRWLLEHNEPLPRALVVSAGRAPRFRQTPINRADPSDEELLRILRSFGTLPEQGLSLLIPSLRADMRLYRNYIAVNPPVLPIPIIAYGGTEDPNVRAEHLEAWCEQTSVSFIRREFPGGHFYLSGNSRTDFLRFLVDDLTVWLR